MKRALALLAVLVTACSETAAPPTDEPVIVTTVSPITDLVGEVVCDAARVEGLVPEGVNSHTFEPRPSDAQTLSSASMFIANGLNLELPSIELAAANLPEGAVLLELGPLVLDENEWIFDFSFPRSEGDPNPHIWTDPTLAIEMVDQALMASSRVLEADESLAENADRLKARLRALDEAIRAATATVPEDNRKLLTYHDSFPYFARTYGWTVVGAIQPSDFSEPSAREVAELIDQIRAESVPAIFGSEVFPSPVLESIAAETGAVYVDDLRDDDLPGEPGDPNHSYLGLMVENLRTMVTALGGDPAAFDTVDTTTVCAP